MEALVFRATAALSIALVPFLSLSSMAASHRTENFIVTAQSKPLAVEIAEAAERYRAELAVAWLGKELPRWSQPCPIQVKVGPRLGAGGATSFSFATQAPRHFARPTGDGLFQSRPPGRPFGWDMSVQGSRERVLDSVLPHEVTHTIFATYFGRPLPRWADEGACTTVEHTSEKMKQHRMLYEFLTTERGIPFNRMFAMTEYPADILPLYSQGFSLSRFLINQGGRRKFIRYIEEGLNTNAWTAATQQYYGFSSLSDLQVTWLDWVRSGSPDTSGPPRQTPGEERMADRSPSATAVASRFREGEREVRSAPAPTDSRSGSWYLQQRRSGKSADRGQKTVPTATAMQISDARPGPDARPEADHDAVRRPPPEFSADRRSRFNPASERDSKGVSNRVTSRPDPSLGRREVLMEWGQPSPFLAPRLAESESASTSP